MKRIKDHEEYETESNESIDEKDSEVFIWQ